MTLRANELRVTNFVSFKNIIINPVIFIGYDSVELVTPKGQTMTAKLDDIQPIPLSEEWLLKFGFELLTDKKKGYKNTSYSHGKIPILLYWDGSRLSTTFWQGNEMRFVHQLQNLIFALTGTELEIKK